MQYSTEIHDSAQGFDLVLTAVQKFNPNRFMYALQYKNWNETDIERMARNVTECRERMEGEYERLVAFAKQFNKEFVTNDNKRYATALVMLRKLRSGISETKRIFAKFCPRARRKSVAYALADKPRSAYDHAYISMDTYQLPLFSLENYPPSISRLYNEMERFFFVLVRCIQLCKQVLEEEQVIRKDGRYCKYLYDEFRGKVLREIADIIMLIPRDSVQLSEENNSAIASRSQCANDDEWAPMGFHSYTKTDVKLLIIRQVLDEESKSELTKEESDNLSEAFKSQLPNIDKTNFFVEVQSMGESAQPVVITQSEYMRRMKDISRYQSGMAFYGEMPDSYSMVLNSDHPIIKRVLDETTGATKDALKPILAEIKGQEARLAVLRQEQNKKKPEEVTQEEKDDMAATEKAINEQKAKKTEIITDCAKGNAVIHQLIDLALLQNGMLKGAALSAFLKRSVDLIK